MITAPSHSQAWITEEAVSCLRLLFCSCPPLPRAAPGHSLSSQQT